MSTEHEVLFSAQVIAESVRRLAQRIDEGFRGESLVVLAVLKGAAIFAADLVRVMSRADMSPPSTSELRTTVLGLSAVPRRSDLYGRHPKRPTCQASLLCPCG
jgi:hypothetical protein